MGTEKMPLGFVTITSELRSSAYISCETPAAVE
jgi:hypothetical protein